MKKVFVILVFVSMPFIWCVDANYVDLQPANPPMGIELLGYDSDYLLLFRSENRSNTRFGGFLVFTGPEAAELTREVDFEEMSDSEQAEFIAGAASTLEGAVYNIGMDALVPVMFSDDESYVSGSVIEAGGESYTIISRQDKSNISAGEYLTLRTYLVDLDGIIIRVSAAGNAVLIE